MSIDEIFDLLSSFGPSEQHRNEVQRSWFGTIIGRATVLLGMLTLYLCIAMWLYSTVEELASLYKSNQILFFCIFSVPLALLAIPGVFLISRVLREGKLRPLSLNEESPEPGYFRLHPYEASDSQHFARPDGALIEAINWLERTDESVLYLSGPSGSGKSSLVNAGLSPVLRERGWKVLNLRGMGAPSAALKNSLRNFTKTAGSNTLNNEELRDLMIYAGEECERLAAGPLLITLDQFEEFLILEHGVAEGSYAEFLRQISSKPVSNVRLLHIFRSDYRELIFRERLPDYIDGKTAFSLPCFTRRDAESFLKGGPVHLDATGYDELFVGLDRIEETRGLYRPITLNMIGFVLERQGDTLATEPGELIETYLIDCITHDQARDFSRHVLNALITREGTKEPHGVSDLAKKTQLETWQVKATLSVLHHLGLVRPVGEVWEISHDFLARLIVQITGRIKRPWFSRFGGPTLLVAGFGWLVAISVAVPAYVQEREVDAMDSIRSLGFALEPNLGNGLHFVARDRDRIDNDSLFRFGQYAKHLEPIKRLDLYGLDKVTNLKGISEIESLTELALADSRNLKSLAGIENLTALNTLNLRRTGITSLDRLKGLTRLEALIVSDTAITSLAGIEELSSLRSLGLNGTYRLKNLQGIENLSSLKSLSLSRSGVDNLTGIESLTSLEKLNLSDIEVRRLPDLIRLTSLETLRLEGIGIRNLAGIEGLVSLKTLDLDGTGISSLAGIEGLKSLEDLDLIGARNLKSLDGIGALSSLKSLAILRTGITDLARIEGLSSLQSLTIGGPEITSISEIKELTSLKNLDINATGINKLDGLEGATSLESLSIIGTKVSSLAKIEPLTSLKDLQLRQTGLTSLSTADCRILRRIEKVLIVPDVTQNCDR